MNRAERRRAVKNLKKKRAGRKMKKYNLTDKLNFEENPKIEIKDIEVEVNTEAKTVLKAASAMDGDNVFNALNEAYELLFSEGDRKKIDALNLNVADFMSLVNTAVALAIGSDPDEQGNE